MRALVALLLFVSVQSFATVKVFPRNSGPKTYLDTSVAQTTYYYPGVNTSSDSISGGNVDTAYRSVPFYLDEDAETLGARYHTLIFDVYSDQNFSVSSGQQLILVVLVEADNGDSFAIPISEWGAGTLDDQTAYPGFLTNECDSSNGCQGIYTYIEGETTPVLVNDYLGVRYTSKSVLRIGIYPKDICDVATILGKTLDGCSGITSSGMAEFTLKFEFRVAESTTSILAATGSAVDRSSSKGIRFSDTALGVYCDTPDGMYFPGDSEIALFTSSVSTTQSSRSAPKQDVIVISNNGGLPAFDSSDFRSASADIIQTVNHFGEQSITGFTNATSAGANNLHDTSITVRSAAGIVSDFVGGNCQFDVQTSRIFGFLNEGQCFIATAVYESSRKPEVLLLREFRDRVLKRFAIGRVLVKTYYTLSPPAALWLIENPQYRPIVKLILKPFEFFGWLMLNWLQTLVGLFVFLCGFALVRFRASRVLLLSVFLLLGEIPRAEETQPYIDELRSKIDEGDDYDRTVEIQPYIDSLLSKDESEDEPEESGSYIEALREKIVEKDTEDSDDEEFANEKTYIERRQEELGPAEQGGAIQAVHEGKSELEAKYVGEVKNSVSFRMGAAATYTITGEASISSRTFEQIYGKAWRPDLTVTYERQLLRSEIFGNVGYFGSLGAIYGFGKGQFEFDPQTPSGGNFGTTSRATFNFFAIPVTLGVSTRFNLLRILRPYVFVGPTTFIYFEDGYTARDDPKGFSVGYTGVAGVSLLLDWFDSGNSWSLYDELGVRHSFLNVEFVLSDTLFGKVDFQSLGFFAGIGFEF